ncbi:hypothetical protein L7F22_014444 [Adiantum nelumboides]|nr:hypothetical protein [Adiantum nelumboides]
MANGTPAPTEAIHSQYDSILILDFGSQYSHLITRRCRELNVYCEMLPCTQKIKDLDWKPKGIILSGSPYSVYDKGAPRVDPDVFEAGVPVLGICYGLQEIAWNHGGKVDPHDRREYGKATIDVVKTGNAHMDALFAGEEARVDVWMSHGDQLSVCPPDFEVVAKTSTAPFAALAHKTKPIYGIQFHAEVTHSPRGKELFENFVERICHCRRDWNMETFIDKEIARIRELVGPKGRVIGAISGGVDSSVAAKLMHEAIGDRFHAVMVDNGVLRAREAAQVYEMLSQHLGVNVTIVDASELFLGGLKVSMTQRRSGRLSETPSSMSLRRKRPSSRQKPSGKKKKRRRRAGSTKPRGNTSSCSRVCLSQLLIKRLCRRGAAAGQGHGHSCSSRWSSSLPGPGLAIRILGPVTRSQVEILQQADTIYIEEIRKAGIYDEISQAFAVLLPVRAVGVQGDKRTYDQVIALRAAQTTDFMTATWYPFSYDFLSKVSNRITNEVQGVNRVVYDVSSKPPSTIEWL